jgi:hypothetical protein
MKKFYTCFVIALFSLLPSYAQLTIRPHLGFNVSKLSKDPGSFDASSRVGSQFGAFLITGNRIFLQTGLQYANVGSELVYRESGQFQNQEIEAIFRGIRVPLYAGWRANPKDDFLNLRLFAGPSVAWVLSKKEENSALLSKETYTDALWGANIGAGFDLGWFFLDANLELGLNDAFKISSAKNHVFGLNGGMRITLGE